MKLTMTMNELERLTQEWKEYCKVEKFNEEAVLRSETMFRYLKENEPELFDDFRITLYAVMFGQCMVDIFNGQWLDPDEMDDLIVSVDMGVGLMCLIKPIENITRFLNGEVESCIVDVYREIKAVKSRRISIWDIKRERGILSFEQVTGKAIPAKLNNR